MQFRHEARQALARAKELLAQNEGHALRYAALELRLTLEASVYERLDDYKRDVPRSAYETWQPPKVLRYLLEIDPNADRAVTVRFTRKAVPGGAPAASFAFSEMPLDLMTLKANYDALGSYLHMPTLKQSDKTGGPDFQRLRQRCEELVAALDPMVTPAKNTFIGGTFTHCPCYRCGSDMRKRLSPGLTGELAARCIECDAEHRVAVDAEGNSTWTSNRFSAPCAHEPCPGVHGLFADEITEGRRWTCQICGQDSILEFGLFPVIPNGALPEEDDGTSP